MSLKAIDTGFLRNLVSYDNIGNISLPASLSIFVNKEVATKEYVDAQNSGQVLQSRTLTINGVTYDLSANRSWTIDSMVYPSAGIALSSGTGWGTSITNNSANWNTAFGWGNHALAGYVPYTGAAANVNLGSNYLTAFGVSTKAIELTGNGTQGGYLYIKQGILPFGSLLGSNAITADANKFVLVSNVDGVNIKLASFDLDSLTTNVTRNYTLPNASGTLALTSNLTGFEVLSNKSNNAALGLSDTLYPTQGAVKSYVDSAVTGGVNIQGDWNANTNTPNISGTTTTGFTWRVSVAGSTNLGGITTWNVNDLAVKTASGWIKIDNSSSVVSVYGRQGVVVANTGDYTTAQVTELGNLYFTTSRARASFSAGTNVSIDVNGVISSTDTNTWTANAKDVAGYVAAPVTATANKVWKTDGSGNPAWRDDADTITTSLAWTSITSRPTALSQFTNDLGNYGSFLTSEADTLATVTTRGSSTAQNITFTNGRKGLVGVYDAAQTQAIFAMGSSYVLTNGGASNVYGSFYGLAWSYNPDYGGAGNNPQSKAGLNHQLLLMQNGVTTAAIGSGIWTSGSISAANFSGSHSGTSSGTNTGDQTNISGNAATATSAASATISTFVSSPDGDRVAGTKLPTGNPRAVRFDFANANSVTGATGNYAGVMTYAPWDGTTASTGDSSYQLAFINESGVNASGAPGLRFRNGIDSTWNGWTSIITSSNIGSYTAGGVAWTNVSGRPTALSQFTNNLGNYGDWVVRSGDDMTGRLTIDTRNANTNLPLHLLSVEPYIQLQATGTGNSTSFRMYPTGGYTASIGNYATGELCLVAANSEAVFINSNSIRVNKYRFNGNGSLSGNGLVEIVDMAEVGMATQANSYRWYSANAVNILMSLNTSGHLTANAFFEASDIRYKNVIETNPDITGLGIDVIKYTRDGSDMVRYGYSAQQVQAIIPESVHGEDTLTVNYMDVHTLKIASLERRVKELEDKLKSTL
jgi:hypothetical protein